MIKADVVWCSEMKQQHVLVGGVRFERQRYDVSEAHLLWNGILSNTATFVMQ